MKLKSLLANKNVVTIIGAVLIVIVLYAFYKWRVNTAINPISVPYAKEVIGPRTKITNEMIGYVDIQQSSIKGSVLTNANTQIIGMYTNVNSTIPAGSLFYEGIVVRYEELADSYLLDMPKDEEGKDLDAYNFRVSTESTYGNSIYPGNYVDIYFKSLVGEGFIKYGKLASDVKAVAVYDASGQHVFENITENRQPSLVILAVTKELHALLRVAESIRDSELIIVPTSVAYHHNDDTQIVTEVSDNEIKTYIESFMEVVQ